MSYEEFNLTGFSVRGVKLRLQIVTADYGDGYGDAALTGSAYGLRRWMIQCDALVNDPAYMVNRKDGAPQTRAEYFLEFWQRHQAEITDGIVTAVNKPFIFRDPESGKKYYASFVEPELGRAVLTSVVSTVGIEIRQRRIRGENTLPDGSIDDATTPANPDET